jgi:TM2 domain-containing protein
MFCRNCARDVPIQAVMCVGCGSPPRTGNRFCWSCGCETAPTSVACVRCGVSLAAPPVPGTAFLEGQKSRIAAGLLGIFLGGFGIHRFYLGFVGIGLTQLLLSTVVAIATCGLSYAVAHAWGFVEGILLLVGAMNRDAHGTALRE